jgi:hypothetical protein
LFEKRELSVAAMYVNRKLQWLALSFLVAGVIAIVLSMPLVGAVLCIFSAGFYASSVRQ